MATYYWVGGSGTWDATSTTHWAASSGGTGGAGVPTNADTAIFDSGSAATVYISGTVKCSVLTINNIVGLTFTSSVGAIIEVTTLVNNYLENNSIYTSATTLKIINFTGSARYNQYSLYPFYRVECSGFIQNINFSSTLINPIYEVIASVSYFTFYAKALDLTVTSLVLYSSADTRVYRTLTINTSSYVVPITVCQDLLVSSLPVSVATTKSSGDVAVKIEKGTCRFGGVGSLDLSVDTAGTSAITIELSTTNTIGFYALAIDGNATRKVTVTSTSAGTRAILNYTGATKVISNVSVKDIQVKLDDKIISYTTDSINLGNNWQWYFDSFKKPIRNLFYGSHV